MLNIVLFEPEIPENVGNIARSCVAFNAKLHLIRPYGFIFDLNKLKRSSTNHWKDLIYHEYNSYEEFMELNSYPNVYIYTRYGEKAPNEFEYNNNSEVYIMFGRESSGVRKDILDKHANYLIRIPMSIKMQSLNLANTVAIAIYEVVKQWGYKDLSKYEPHKRKK